MAACFSHQDPRILDSVQSLRLGVRHWLTLSTQGGLVWAVLILGVPSVPVGVQKEMPRACLSVIQGAGRHQPPGL